MVALSSVAITVTMPSTVVTFVCAGYLGTTDLVQGGSLRTDDTTGAPSATFLCLDHRYISCRNFYGDTRWCREGRSVSQLPQILEWAPLVLLSPSRRKPKVVLVLHPESILLVYTLVGPLPQVALHPLVIHGYLSSLAENTPHDHYSPLHQGFSLLLFSYQGRNCRGSCCS